jgi:hypothetical protein
MNPHNDASTILLSKANLNTLWVELLELCVLLKTKYIVRVIVKMPTQEIMVPSGKVESLTKGLFNTGEPVTIRKRQEIRIIVDK